MRVIDARNPDEEFVVAEAVCDGCDEPIEQVCTPLAHEGQTYPPVFTWKHSVDGAVLCEKPRMARPKSGTVVARRQAEDPRPE